MNIDRTDRRDKMCLVIALAVVLLTLLGHVGEQLGLARTRRANTVQRRTHSLFRQGREYFRGPVGRRPGAVPLLWATFWDAFGAHPTATEEWGVI